jgi:hypothetical protein
VLCLVMLRLSSFESVVAHFVYKVAEVAAAVACGVRLLYYLTVVYVQAASALMLGA